MADFKRAYDLTTRIEGGYVNDPDDTGGETYKGISRKNFPGWQGWEVIDEAKRSKLSVALLNDHLNDNPGLQSFVESFYKKEFWDVLNLDNFVNQYIAGEMFDTAVNMGVSTAATFLQKALNVLNRNQLLYGDIPITGKVGPLTLEAVNKQRDFKDLLKVMNCLQGSRYVEICLANPKQEKFIRGWLDRVDYNYY